MANFANAQRCSEVGTVLLVLPWSPDNQGGVTNVVKNLMGNWPSDTSTRPVLAIDNWASPRAVEAHDGVNFRFSALGPPTFPNLLKSFVAVPIRLFRTRALMRQYNVHAVNFHYPGLSAFVTSLTRKLGFYRGNLILSFHGSDVRPPSNWLERLLRPKVLGMADAIVACSCSLADRLSNTLGVPRERIQVIVNGVDTSIFRPDAPRPVSWQTELPSAYLVSIGAFFPLKAQAVLIQAYSRLLADRPQLHLCLAGADGPELSS